MTRRQGGHVGVAAVANNILPALIKTFVQRYPNIRVHVEDDTAEVVRRKVLDGEIDLGIASLWERDGEIEFHELCRDPVGLVCHREHPLLAVESLSWDLLAEHKPIGNGTVRLLGETLARKVMEHSQLTISNTTSLLAMVEANVGITTLPWLAFPRERPNLRFRAIRDPVVERSVGLLTRAQSTLPPAAAAMRELVLELFPELMPPMLGQSTS